jgi:HSP20 family protein
MRMDPFSYLQTRMNQLWREFDKEFSPILQKLTPSSTTTSVEPPSSTALTTMAPVSQSLASWMPSSVRLDVSEGANEISVVADLPGFPRDSIKATVDDAGMLHIRASKQEEISKPVSEGGQEWTWRERHSGSVQRSIQLPASVDPAAAHAEFRDGVLTMKFNKKAEKKGHLIDIK